MSLRTGLRLGLMWVALIAMGDALGQESKLPIPDADTQKKSESMIRDTYKDEYTKNQPTQKKALSKILRDQARDSSNEPPLRYALFKEALDLAQQAGDGAGSWEIVDEWGRAFSIDTVSAKSAVAAGMVTRAKLAEEFKGLASIYLNLTEEALKVGNLEAAVKASENAVAMAKKGKDLPMFKQAEARLKSLSETKGLLENGKKAVETLERQPDDPETNLVAGKYYCFMRNDWERGLPCLVKGSDLALKDLAQKEAATPNNGEALKLGDGWWDAGERETKFRSVCRDRSLSWYLKAWEGVQGLSKEKIRSRLRAAAGYPSASKAGGSPANWRLTVGISSETAFAHAGKNSIRCTPDPSSGNRPFTGADSLRLAAKPGATYEISCWVFADGAEGPANHLLLRFWKAGGEFISQAGPITPSDMPVWTLVTQSVQCPTGVDQIDVSFQMWAKKGVIWIDEISLKLDGKELLSNGSFEDLGR